MSRVLLCLHIILLGYCPTRAQGVPLKIGDTVPDLTLSVHLGDSVRITRLSSFGMPVIFDYWGVHCSSCITESPKLYRLQRKFRDSVAIIRFTDDPDSAVNKMWANLANWSFRAGEILDAEKHLFSITGDTVLLKMFPTHQYGLNIWIDKDRVVRVLTGSTIYEDDIGKFLHGQTSDLPVHHFIGDFDNDHPFTWFGRDTNFSDRLDSYSFFLKYIELGSGNGFEKLLIDSQSNSVVGMTCGNQPILDLYGFVFRKNKESFDNIVLETKDSSRFVCDNPERYMQWIVENTFCYAVKVPSAQSRNVFQIMKQEIDRYFQLSTSVENRLVKCWVLREDPGKDMIRSKGGKAFSGVYKTDSGQLEFIIRNSKIGRLLNEVRNVVAAHYTDLRFTPVLDETGYKGNIDMDLPWEKEGYRHTSIETFQKWLKTYGLELIKEYRMRKVLVIKDAKATS